MENNDKLNEKEILQDNESSYEIGLNNKIHTKHDNQLVQQPVKEGELPKGAKKPAGKEGVVYEKTKLGTFGFVMLIFAIIGFAYGLISSLSFLVLLVYYLIAAVVLIMSLLTVNWLEGGEGLAQFTLWLFNSAPYALSVSMSLCMLSFIIFMVKKKYAKRKLGIILSIVFFVLSLIVALLNHFTIINIS